MNAKDMVDSLFDRYEQTTALADFKEELLSNLNAKIESLVNKGMDPEAAFTKASAELGDVSVLADELSLIRRKEVFEEVYMDIKKYMNAKRVAAYVIFGISALFGIIAAFIAFFAVRDFTYLRSEMDMTSFFAVILPFLCISITGFTFLGCTQETASSEAMSNKRAAWYAASAFLIGFGFLTMPLLYFSQGLEGRSFEILPVLSLVIPFILPGGGLLAFLVLTEKDRLKPWAKDMRKKFVEREMAMWKDPVTASRFGMYSGAIWIFAAGLFILLGFLIGFKFSWLIFIFAVAFQLLIQGLMSKTGK